MLKTLQAATKNPKSKVKNQEVGRVGGIGICINNHPFRSTHLAIMDAKNRETKLATPDCVHHYG